MRAPSSSRLRFFLCTLAAWLTSPGLVTVRPPQMLFDIEQAYNEFFRSLSDGSGNGSGETGM